ncbi:MAG: hypothetical protein KC620_21145, partial [Myxococcales bacterium]|nr:hypothetical protein [Myxococcales bacterium]
GTLAYLAIWGFFARGTAKTLLSAALAARVSAGVCLVLSHPKHLSNKGLIVLFLMGLICALLTSFLQGFPPMMLVSITDALAALIVSIVGAIYGLIYLIRGVRATIRLVTAVV